MTVGLALSGGGTRAVAYHAGVLRRLAMSDVLESVSRISTVSGGSIAAAAILSLGGGRWPNSQSFLQNVYPRLRGLATTTPILTWGAVARMPSQWINLPGRRARVLAHSLETNWGITGRLASLPTSPDWAVNATCYETGKNWRFSKSEMGDWIFGRHKAPDYTVAEVVAASAAVPYAIGSLKFQLPSEGWFEVTGRAETIGSPKKPSSSEVHLWDGGAYENLGLESLYKVESGPIGCKNIFVSDASGPVPQGNRSLLMMLLKGNLPSPKLFDIASDQIRSLRSRIIVDAFHHKKVAGAVFRMTNTVRDIDRKANRSREENEYLRFLDKTQAAQAWEYPTNLAALREQDFDLIARLGFEIADATLGAYRSDICATTLHWPGA